MELNGTFDAGHVLGIPTGAASRTVAPMSAENILTECLDGAEVSLQGVYWVARSLGVELSPAPPAGLVCAVRGKGGDVRVPTLSEVCARTRGSVRAILWGEGSDEGTVVMLGGAVRVPGAHHFGATILALESSSVVDVFARRGLMDKHQEPWSRYSKRAVRKARRVVGNWVVRARAAEERELVSSTLSQLRAERATAPWHAQPTPALQVLALLQESYKAHPRLAIAGAGAWPATWQAHVWTRHLHTRAGGDASKLELRPYRATLGERVTLGRRAVRVLQPSWSAALRENTSLSHVRGEFPELALYPFFPLDITFGGVDGPNLVAGYNTVYGYSRGSQNRGSVVRALRRQLTPKIMVLLDDIAKEWTFANVEDLWAKFDRDADSTVSRYPADLRRCVEVMFDAERRFARDIMDAPSYFPRHQPTPTTALVLEWRRRSWDVSYPKCLWNTLAAAPPKPDGEDGAEGGKGGGAGGGGGGGGGGGTA